MTPFGERAVRAMLRLFPDEFRRRFGAEMLGTYLDQRDALPSGRSRAAHTLSTVFSLAGAIAHTRKTAMRHLFYDARHALRSLRKQPMFTGIAVITLALGIGANTAVFSVLKNAVLAPLPYTDPERLVRVYSAFMDSPRDGNFLSGPDITDLRDGATTLSSVGIMYTYRETGGDLMVDGTPQRVPVLSVSAEYFSTLGATPEVGRVFTRDEERPGAGTIILSHALWTSLTNRDRNVAGTFVELDGQRREVVGVMRAGFRDVLGGDIAAWTPHNLEAGPSNRRGNMYLSAFARLAPGVTLAQAQSEIDGIMGRLRAELPDSNEHRVTFITPLLDDVVGDSRFAVLVLMGAAGLVLLIACLNVASLFLARAIAQGRESAIRTALGAVRARLISERLTESLIVALAGGVAGTILAVVGVNVLLLASPDSLARSEDVGFDPAILAFTLITTVVTGLLFGTAPAVRASRADPADALHDGSRGNTGGRASRNARSVLVASQVALAVILLAGAGVLIRSFIALDRAKLGFDANDVATFEINLPASRYGDAARRVQFHQQFTDALAGIPGVATVGSTSWLPANGPYHIWGTGYLDAAGERQMIASQNRVVDGAFFKALRIPFVKGRTFARGEGGDSVGVAVVNTVFAQRVFGAREAIGQLVRVSNGMRRVIGVVSDVAIDVRGGQLPHVYLSHDGFAANRNWPLHYVVRASAVSPALFGAARAALAASDPQLVLHRPRALDAVLDRHRAQQRFTLMLMTTFAGIALTLAAVGLYGVLSYAVTQRTHEIGVRIALGAQAGHVRAIVVAQAARVAGTGLVIGIVGALAVSRLMKGLVFGVSERDPLVFLAVPLALAFVAVVAGYVPARRATKIAPLDALRRE